MTIAEPTGSDRKRVLLFGASGTIGRATANALLNDGHTVTCVLRLSASGEAVAADLEAAGARCRFADVTDAGSVMRDGFAGDKFDTVVTCLASRSGTPEDARRIDYKANSDILKAAQANGVPQMILLSAICVQKPRLAFQHAKLAFERELMGAGLAWSIIRPTAFFKSLSGQIERVKNGKPFLLFGNGELTRCKPISDADLGRYISRAVTDTDLQNRILPIGGPGPAISPKEQGEKLFKLLGKTPRFRHVSLRLMDAIIGALSFIGRISARAAAKAEYARIGRYYATESMLVLDQKTGDYRADLTPETGRDTLFEHYEQVVGGEVPAP